MVSDPISDEEEKGSGNVDETMTEMVKNAETGNLKALLVSTKAKDYSSLNKYIWCI